MFPVENQKGIQEKQLPFNTIPSRAGLGRETRCSYRSLTSFPFLHFAGRAANSRASVRAGRLRSCGGASVGECVRVCALARGGPVYAAGCGLSAAAAKPSESTCGPNRIEMTPAFLPIRRRSIIHPAQSERSKPQSPRLKQKRRRVARSPGLA